MNDNKMVESVSGEQNQIKTARTFFKDRYGFVHVAVDKPLNTNRYFP